MTLVQVNVKAVFNSSWLNRHGLVDGHGLRFRVKERDRYSKDGNPRSREGVGPMDGDKGAEKRRGMYTARSS